MSFSKKFSSVPELSPDTRVRVFRSSFSNQEDDDNITVDAYAIITERFVVLCDTLLCPDDMRQACALLEQELAGRQLLVVNSHGDWDHVWGNSYLAQQYNPLIIGHKLCPERLLSAHEAAILQSFQAKYPLFLPVVLVPPALTFSDCLILAGGDLTLKLFASPGHKTDHIALWLPELRLLLAFDALEYPFPEIGAPELVPAMFATLEHFQQLQPASILCSHGNINTPTLIAENLIYLRTLEQRCQNFLSHTPQVSEEALEQAAQLIGYPYSELADNTQKEIDHSYYEYAHTENIRSMLRWLAQRT